MTINRLKQGLTNRTMRFINERRGWETDRKIVVIESDDWGSIRTPSLKKLNSLIDKGVKFALNLGYDYYDTLESNEDLEMLGNVLAAVKDKNGNPAVMTLNYNLANPDFSKIKDSNYEEYHYELFTDTLKSYPNHDRVLDLLKRGIDSKLFKPQFHGREHLNVQMWLKSLQNDVFGVRDSFENSIYSNHITKTKSDNRTKFREAYNVKNIAEYKFIEMSIEEGLKIFEKIFGYKSKTIIATNYTWDKVVENYAYNYGVKGIQGSYFQKYSEYEMNRTNKLGVYNYLGKKNKNNQVYLIRNAYLEPSQNSILNYRRCLADVEKAFRLKKPAIISSHRLNFIGGLDEKNRSENLKQLSNLLACIKLRYTNVEFMSSDALLDIIQNEGLKA